MLFVSRFTWKPGVEVSISEVIDRRAKWQPPEGTTVLGEYWPVGDDIVSISIFESSSSAAILAGVAAWGDIFDISVRPVVTPEEGMEVLTKMFGGSE